MRGCDYVVEGFIHRGIKHVCGYPGGMVTYLMEALDKRKNAIADHILYHEQACAFAACASAQVSGVPGIVCHQWAWCHQFADRRGQRLF